MNYTEKIAELLERCSEKQLKRLYLFVVSFVKAEEETVV